MSHDWPASVRRTIAELDLTYYLPCTVRGPHHRLPGVSRTEEGDFLSSDDVELLVTLSGYVGIAIENARLYRSLQRKVEEYERLKEFSENIVESINVGILAADLDDRVESWNTQIERLTGIAARKPRWGGRCRSCFRPSCASSSTQVRGENRHPPHLQVRAAAPTGLRNGNGQRQWERQWRRQRHGRGNATSEHRHRAAGLEGPASRSAG